jgi:CheY-like chemotaxis protein
VSVSVAHHVNVTLVLVIEDDVFIRTDIADGLRAAGYDVVESPTGEQALALCSPEIAIDMVFTDINLGGSMTGWDVADHLRTERPDLPVLYTSSHAIDPERCGPRSMFVAKPYRHGDILRACERLCRRTHRGWH